jgi:hypothetical protein
MHDAARHTHNLCSSKLSSACFVLQRHKKSIYFRYPVDHVSLNLPEYTTIIKHPMDLLTVSSVHTPLHLSRS